MSVGDAILSLGGGPLTLVQRTFGALDSAGRQTAATESETEIAASVQPVSGDDLQRLPEGISATDFVTVFTKAQLVTADTVDGRDADVIVYRGEEYEIVGVEPWAEAGDYYRATAQKARKARP